MDYDSQRHQLENLQRASRRDEYKIARARDALETARTTYEVLNKVCTAVSGSRDVPLGHYAANSKAV